MIQNYDIRVRNVHDYNEFVGAEDLHSHVSVIHYDELPPIRHCRALWGVYGLFLLDDDSERLGYGSGTYDYSVGSIVCVSPSQIGGVADDGTGACSAGVLAAMAFCRKRCFLNISLRSVCVGTVTFSFSVGFDADWVLHRKVRFFRFSCIARNLR